MAYNTFVVAVERLGVQLDCGLVYSCGSRGGEGCLKKEQRAKATEKFTPVVVPIGGVIAEAAFYLLACGLAVEDEGTGACGFGEFGHIGAIVANNEVAAKEGREKPISPIIYF